MISSSLMINKLAFVFPGQGSQSVGMGQESYAQDPLVKSIYDLADKLFAEFHADSASLDLKSISQISFQGPEDELRRTVYTQPAILTLSIALATKIKEKIQSGQFVKPNFVAGHSLGEFSALYMADVLSLEDVISLVIKRAALMELALPGAMSAVVGLSEEELKSLIEKVPNSSVANFNAPDQIVTTGTKEAIQKLDEEINNYAATNSLAVKVIPLSVGGAFHSSLMARAAEEFATEIDKVNFRDASIPVIQNINAMPVTSAVEIKENLKKQMTGSVQWTKTVAQLIDETSGINEIWEVGPGKVLAGLVKKQNRRFAVKNISDLNSISENAIQKV